jgi:N-acetylglucosaminyl-diphospho-decaprenol L-rhamnosyltransferase
MNLAMDTYDLSIIIVNWNTRELLARCLETIAAVTRGASYEIIVVDNASRDGSADMIRERFPDVRLICNDMNAGFGVANNQGMAVARGRHMLLLNSDTELQPGSDALSALAVFADAHPDAGAVGPKLLNLDGSLQPSWARFPTLASELLGRTVRAWTAWPGEPGAYETEWLSGACLLVPRAVLAKTGGFDPRFFMYSEETDWCYRIRRAGYRVAFLERAHLLHLGGGSASRTSHNQLYRLYSGKILFFHVNYGALSSVLLRLGLSIALGVSGVRRWMRGSRAERERARVLWRVAAALLNRRSPEGKNG